MGKTHLLDVPNIIPYSSVYLDYRNGRKVTLRIGTDNADDYKAWAVKYFNQENILRDEYFSAFDQLVKEGLAINEGFRCYPDALAYVIEQRDLQKRTALVSEKYGMHIDNGVFDQLINAKLFPYQKEGVCFAASKGRCIIADDMGLGKTIQAIAATELLRKETGISAVWIICPTSLKYQWKSEIEKFTGLQSLVIEGNYIKRLEQYQSDVFYKIISYNTAVNDINDINATGPDLFILDEAQRIKNFKTKIATKIKQLNSPFTFVLTGTPLENKLEELYSVTQFVDPYVLGPYWQFLANHQIIDDKGKIKGYKDLNKVGQMLAGTMIRRRKKDVLLQMPERMDKVLLVPMTDEQMTMHNEYKNVVAQLIFKWQRQKFLTEKDRHRLMINLNMMRMVCDSTYIIDQETRFDTRLAN
jgi:SNF2 family DNA or RNA helicase